MMHCTMDDVLALRAGEGSAWARQHAAGCAACRAELEALYQRVAQLKALPARGPARDRWPAVRDAVLRSRYVQGIPVPRGEEGDAHDGLRYSRSGRQPHRVRRRLAHAAVAIWRTRNTAGGGCRRACPSGELP